MIFRNVYLGMSDERISLLKQLLNELLNPSPNLVINNKYDDETKLALKRFEIGIEERLDVKNRPIKANAYGRPQILPADGKIDSTTWIAIGMALKIRQPERFRNLVQNDRELSDLFGLIPGTLEVNQYPPFSSSDFNDVKDGLELAKKKVNESIEKDNVLIDWGISSVLQLLEGVKLEGTNRNVFDGRKSYRFSWDGGTKESKREVKTLKQYFIDEKKKVGAIVEFNGGRDGKNVMFIGDYFFNPYEITNLAYQRAFIIMHESVHLIGNKTDEDFGGSKNLSELLRGKFMPALKDLGGVA